MEEFHTITVGDLVDYLVGLRRDLPIFLTTEGGVPYQPLCLPISTAMTKRIDYEDTERLNFRVQQVGGEGWPAVVLFAEV